MRDLKLVKSDGFFDLDIGAADLATEDGLDSAAVLSIFTESAARGSVGYWADAIAATEGDRWGSALRRSAGDPNTQANRIAIMTSIERSLDWAIEDGVAGSVSVESGEYQNGRLILTVAIEHLGALSRWTIYWDVHRGRIGLAPDASGD